MNTPCKMRKILILPNVANAPTLIGVYDTSCNLVESYTLEIPLSYVLVPFFVAFENKGVKPLQSARKSGIVSHGRKTI